MNVIFFIVVVCVGFDDGKFGLIGCFCEFGYYWCMFYVFICLKGIVYFEGYIIV